MEDSPRKKAIVVGAGIGGLATAARLAHAGLDVEIYEKNDFFGGRCSLIHHDGYRFDQGPSLLLLPPLFRTLFSDLGTSFEKEIELFQCHPNYVVHYHDGEVVTLSSDRAQLGREVERYEGSNGAGGLEGFLAEAALHGRLSYDLVLSKHFPSILALLRPSFLRQVFALHPFVSLYSRTARYFKTERMRRAFSFGSMYLGSSPFDSPGTYTLLQWTETCEGIWYPKGGFHAVPRSLLDIAQSYNATFHPSTPVSLVTHDPSSGRVTGVTLENGETREAYVVVVNADLVWAYNNLFTKNGAGHGHTGEVEGGNARRPSELLDPAKAKSLLDKPHSCSSISFYWALDRKIPQLNAHNIFLAEDYKGSFDDIFKRKGMPREPSFYVNVPSRIDETAAPPGKDAVVVLIPVGHLLPTHSSAKGTESIRTFANGSSTVPDIDSQDWPALVERARAQVIEVMEARLGVRDLRDMITWEGVNTPLTWKEKFNLTHGSILGITHDFFNVLSFRHQARHPKVKGAYFVGASAHPGTGVPIAIAGSKLCAEAILSDLSIPLPDTYYPPSPPPRSSLDVKQSRYLSHMFTDFLRAAAPVVLGMLVTLFSLGIWLWTTVRLNTTGTMRASPPPSQIREADPSGQLNTKSPIFLGGSILILILSVIYMKVPGLPSSDVP